MSSHYCQELDYAAAIPVIKSIQHKLVCKNHRLRTRLNSDYDDDGVNVYISKCCCLELAEEVANALRDSRPFANIYLESKTGLTSKTIIL